MPPQLQDAFLAAVVEFVEDLRSHPGQFRPSLRVKRLRGYRDIWEMSWAADGRATFSYGVPVREDEPHIVWRRVGSHDIFRHP